MRWPVEKCQRLAKTRETGMQQLTPLCWQVGCLRRASRDNFIATTVFSERRRPESHWAASKETMGSSTARLLGVEGLAPARLLGQRKIPSVVPERLTGQLRSGVCLEAETSAERAGSSQYMRPLAVNAPRRRLTRLVSQSEARRRAEKR